MAIAPMVALKWNDFDADQAQLVRLKRGLEGSNAKPAWTAAIGYAEWDPGDVAARGQQDSEWCRP